MGGRFGFSSAGSRWPVHQGLASWVMFGPKLAKGGHNPSWVGQDATRVPGRQRRRDRPDFVELLDLGNQSEQIAVLIGRKHIEELIVCIPAPLSEPPSPHRGGRRWGRESFCGRLQVFPHLSGLGQDWP